MRAIVQEGSGSADALHVRDVDIPVPVEGRALVRVRAASVNAGDWHRVHGGAAVSAVGWALRAPAQRISGGDLAGIVETVAGDVHDIKPGDEVFGAGSGSFADYVTATPDRLAPKPGQLTFEEAAAIPVAGCTALRGLRDTARLQPGERVLVYGAGGGVGTFAVQVAAALGGQVTAVTSRPNLDLVQSLVSGRVLDLEGDEVMRFEHGFEVIFDVAATRPLRDLVRLLTPDGRIVMAGAAKGGLLAIVSRLAAGALRSRMGQNVKSFLARVTRADLITLAGFVEEGKLRPVIDRRYALEDAVEAVRYVGTGRARAKVVITVD